MDIKSLLNEQPTSTTCTLFKKPKKTYICNHNDCVKSFKRKSDLIRHRRIHTGERPFQCHWQDCQKTFIQRSALTVHLRTHTGERPHACKYENCQKSFGDSSSLARHYKTHTGNRPYMCDFCNKSFTRKTTLIRHKEHVHRHHVLFAGSPTSVYSDFSEPRYYDCPATPPMSDYNVLYTTEKPAYLPPIYVYSSYDAMRSQAAFSHHPYYHPY